LITHEVHKEGFLLTPSNIFCRAESPSQVSLTVLSALYHHVSENKIPFDEWMKLFVIYDNVCNLDRIHTAQQPLPLPAPLDQLWLETQKVIDVFHLSNHKREECRTTYNPSNIKKFTRIWKNVILKQLSKTLAG